MGQINARERCVLVLAKSTLESRRASAACFERPIFSMVLSWSCFVHCRKPHLRLTGAESGRVI